MSTSTEAQRFWQTLLAAHPRRTQFELEQLLISFRQALPHLQGDAEARSVLARLLAELEQIGALRQPRQSNRRAYDHSERTPLPKRIVRLDRPRSAHAEAVMWRPELAFARDLGIHLREELLAIQEWLRKAGSSAPLVALRERSVEIFGDEKRLDALLGTQLFARDHLTLNLLRCYLPSVPIHVVSVPVNNTSRPLLVVENHTTFDTLCRWNAEHHGYAGIAFGAGSAFVAACRSLRPHLAAAGCSEEVMYFGDLDPTGLWIPARAAEAAGIDVRPDENLYTRLLLKARRHRTLPRASISFEPALLEWLPLPLKAETLRHFNAGRRLPQELVSVHDL